LRHEEEAEFAAFVERNSRFVFRVAYAMLRNSHDAEDAAQETFLKLWRKGAWRGLESERAFLARATWRMAADRIHAGQTGARPSQKREAVGPEDAGVFDLLSMEPNPEEAAMSAAWHASIHRLIDALPEELRQPLALSTVDEMNSREIAAVMRIPEGTVRTRLMRARQMLREKLSVLYTQPKRKEVHHAGL
jgi:RNA polymerase sigma-70 factor (ECF subfamily)